MNSAGWGDSLRRSDVIRWGEVIAINRRIHLFWNIMIAEFPWEADLIDGIILIFNLKIVIKKPIC